jgi:ribonuclease Z
MSLLKKGLVAFVAIDLLLVAIALLTGQDLGERVLRHVMQRQVERNLSGAEFKEMTDGLNVVLCGAGSPLPDPRRSGPCVLVIAGERVMVVDVGSGAVRRIGPEGIPMSKVEDVFLTHFHSDHIDGLGELMMQRWAGGHHASPLPVHGPTGVEDVVAGFNQAYSHDDQYRVAHHGPKIIPPTGAGGVAVPFALPEAGQGVVVLDQDGLKVTAFAVSHPPIVPAVGYRFDYKGRSVVISGDTTKSANLQKFAMGADLLLHEALNPEMVNILTEGATAAGATDLAQITRDIVGYHTTPVQAAEIARDAGVKQLVLYHIVPALPFKPLERMFVKGVDDVYKGGVTVARDGTWIDLPANSDVVKVGSRL